MANNSYNSIRNMLADMMDVRAVISGRVLSVDTDTRTCDIDIDGTSIPGVTIQPIINNNTGIAIFPKVGAQALCIHNPEWDGWALLQASDIDHIDISIGNTTLHLSADGIVINKGSNGGLVNVKTLTSAFNAVVADIHTIAAALNVLNVLNGISEPVVTTAANLPENIADTKIKH